MSMRHLPDSVAITNALNAWRETLGERARIAPEELARYGSHTLHKGTMPVCAALCPETEEEIIRIVQIASRFDVPLYPISIGNNWGYGSASPIIEGGAVIDLSSMRKILSFDRELGLITVQPGVTPLQVRRFLAREQAPFLAPIFGSGNRNSLVGNALDRGHSLTPFTDRFASVHALRAVLPDGTIYASSSGPAAPKSFFKWGVGPYLDGLFCQSNCGIVVNMCFKLAPKPECIEIFTLSVDKKESDLAASIDRLRELTVQLGNIMPSIKIYNPQRVIFQTTSYPREDELHAGILPESLIRKALDDLSLTHWTVMGSLYGDARLVQPARRIVRDAVRPYARYLRFYDEGKLVYLEKESILSILSRTMRRMRLAAPILSAFFWSVSGGTGEGATRRLPLWRLGRTHLAPGETVANIDYDAEPNCGFMFFSAVFPMRGEPVASFAYDAEAICRQYRIEPIVGLYNFSDTSMVATVYLLFDKESDEEVGRVSDCYTALAHASRYREGYVHRLPTTHMDAHRNQNHPFWRLADRIKCTLDPQDIIAPGRYAATHRMRKGPPRGRAFEIGRET